MAIILDGKAVQQKRKIELQNEFTALSSKASLLVVQVGDNEQSNKYIERKKVFGESIGVSVRHDKLPESTTFQDLSTKISEANADPSITGIIVQLPLPSHLDSKQIIDCILPAKDVDGLTTSNQNTLSKGDSQFIPATARGVMELLDAYQIPIKGKQVVIIGRGQLVGKPLFSCFIHRGAMVTVCHQGTPNIPEEIKRADIVVAAAGVPGLVNKDCVRVGQTIVDVGLTAFLDEGNTKLVGDVLFDEVSPIVDSITPSPGGVGPMTILCLFENVLQSYKLQDSKKNLLDPIH